MPSVKFIAEVGLNHNGDVQIAKKLIDIAAENGCAYAKFQKRTISLLATKEVLEARDGRFPSFGDTYGEIRRHLEFDEAEYEEIVCHCKQAGIAFLCTVFDPQSVDFIENFSPQAYKIASHNLTDIPLLEKVAMLRKRTFLSTGMAELDEIDRAVAIFNRHDTELVLFHCVSSYPSDFSEAALSMIPFLRQRYPQCVIGYSGHEADSRVSEYAAVLGAAYIERHITLDHGMEGFDHKISLDPMELHDLMRRLELVSVCLGSAEKHVTQKEMQTRQKYRRSIVSARVLHKGEAATSDMFVMKNPGTGLPSSYLSTLLGKTVARDIPEDTLIALDQFQD